MCKKVSFLLGRRRSKPRNESSFRFVWKLFRNFIASLSLGNAALVMTGFCSVGAMDQISEDTVTEDTAVEEAIGTVSSVSSNGLVSVHFDSVDPKFKPAVHFELDELQFYSGTKLLSDLLSSWAWNENQVMILGECCSFNSRSPALHPRVLKIFQDFPHGRVYINAQIQFHILEKMEILSRLYLNEPQESVFVEAKEDGEVWFQTFIPFRERVLNYTKGRKLPNPETLGSLMKRSEEQLWSEVYVAPYASDKSLQRVKISKIIYGKKEVVVSFIDFGVEEKIKLENIYNARLIDINYARFPSLLFKCQLSGVVHMDVAACASVIKDKVVHVQFASPVTDPDDVEVKPKVKVYCTGTGGSGCFDPDHPDGLLLLNSYIIDEGHGVPEITTDQLVSASSNCSS